MAKRLTSMMVDEELLTQVRIYCLENKTTMRELFDKVFREMVKRPKNGKI